MRISDWSSDVCSSDLYRGPNWKCAQEASIRLLHLATAGLFLGQVRETSVPLRALVLTHLRRIAATMSYAVAQANNHATSEAAALFIGGSWLAANGSRAGESLVRRGRQHLEKQVARLVEEDGSFSQYSLNYHRVLLDTLSIVEIWRRHLDLAPFSALWRKRAAAATDWLMTMVEPANGDAPNLVANDGARLLQLTATGYRDFRPSVQLAASLFRDERIYGPGPHDDTLEWLDIKPGSRPAAAPRSRLFDQGGYAVLKRGTATAVLRYPRFHFRPSQADALHLDLWIDGEHMLRDGGSYSYNSGAHWIDYFGGVASHNSVQFDDADQMPRLGRFLLGDWLTQSRRQPLGAAHTHHPFPVRTRTRARTRNNP